MIWTIVIALFIWQATSALIDLLFMLIEESANKPAKIKVATSKTKADMRRLDIGFCCVIAFLSIFALATIFHW